MSVNSKNILWVALGIFIIYTLTTSLYIIVSNVKLGHGFGWTCYEPGCTVTNLKLQKDPSNTKYMKGIFGDVDKFNMNHQYIIGKVAKPNAYSIEHNLDLDPEGYFILDKINNKKIMGMTKNELTQKCRKHGIDDCSLKKYGILSLIYDPYYWYIILSE